MNVLLSLDQIIASFEKNLRVIIIRKTAKLLLCGYILCFKKKAKREYSI